VIIGPRRAGGVQFCRRPQVVRCLVPPYQPDFCRFYHHVCRYHSHFTAASWLTSAPVRLSDPLATQLQTMAIHDVEISVVRLFTVCFQCVRQMAPSCVHVVQEVETLASVGLPISVGPSRPTSKEGTAQNSPETTNFFAINHYVFLRGCVFISRRRVPNVTGSQSLPSDCNCTNSRQL